MSEATHYWPDAYAAGVYEVHHTMGVAAKWFWSGRRWWKTIDGELFTVKGMIANGYLGVRREESSCVPEAVPQPPAADEAAYPQWARDIVQAINEVRDELVFVREDLAAIERRSR